MSANKELQVGKWVTTEHGQKGRIVSIGRLTATVEIHSGGDYVRIGYLLSRLARLNQEKSPSAH